MLNEERQEPTAWIRLIENCGDLGQQWARRYREAGCIEITSTVDVAVGFLRRRDLQPGMSLLAEAEMRMEMVAPLLPPSGRFALERWYLSALAYLYYCQEQFSQAVSTLDRAYQSVVAAIQDSRFLLILAHHCYDFQLQYARTLRHQRQWDSMKDRIELGRAMLRGDTPLCTLEGSSPIFISDVYDYYEINNKNQEWSASNKKEHLSARVRAYEKLAREIFIIPGFVIPYP